MATSCQSENVGNSAFLAVPQAGDVPLVSRYLFHQVVRASMSAASPADGSPSLHSRARVNPHAVAGHRPSHLLFQVVGRASNTDDPPELAARRVSPETCDEF